MNDYLWMAGFFVISWFTVRWSYIVALKVPRWLDEDWRNQATDFLKIDPVSPEPGFRWWTPFYDSSIERKSFKFLIPIIGPFIERQYMQGIMELLSLPIGLILASLYGEEALYGLCLFGFLIALSLIDFRTMYLPDILVYPLLWLGLLKASFNKDEAYLYLMGAIAGFMVLYILQQVFKYITKRDGMGGGDLKLLAAIGAWIGVNYIFQSLLMACALGIVFYILQKILSKKGGAFPFGPSIAISGFLVYMFKPALDATIGS